MEKNVSGQKCRPIAGFETSYEVTDDGEVWSIQRKNCRSRRRLRPNNARGYWIVKLCLGKKGLYITKGVHRLVADAFVPNSENKPEVNHKDGDKTNNRASNLEWVTSKENHRHALDNGLRRCQGEHNGQAKLMEEDVRAILAKPLIETNVAIAAQFNVSDVLISKIRCHDAWLHIEV